MKTFGMSHRCHWKTIPYFCSLFTLVFPQITTCSFSSQCTLQTEVNTLQYQERKPAVHPWGVKLSLYWKETSKTTRSRISSFLPWMAGWKRIAKREYIRIWETAGTAFNSKGVKLVAILMMTTIITNILIGLIAVILLSPSACLFVSLSSNSF